MSSGIKKPPAPGGMGRRPSTNPPGSSGPTSNSPSRTSSSTPHKTSGNGIVSSRPSKSSGSTPISTRTAAHRARSGLEEYESPAWSDGADDDVRAERLGVLEDLKERLHKAENMAEEYRKQAGVTQSRLDDTLKEQAKLEERVHEEEERIEDLESDKKDILRQRRELEAIYEADRVAAIEEKERTLAREEEMQATIQRLKEIIAQKDIRSGLDEEKRVSRTSSFRSNSPSSAEKSQFAPPASLQRSSSESSSRLLLQKDKVIEDLRLELAEAQIKLVEVENMGGGRLHELEKTLLETRMANARLMEDNESFQLLLSEKTLNGDFSRGEFMRASAAPDERLPSRSGPSTSLAEELESVVSESDNEANRRLEAEIGSLRDQNKALTLYINSIIERLLNHKEFENILDKTPNLMSAVTSRPNVDKDLPPAPDKPSVASSLLQRAKSVAIGSGRPRPRPISQVPVQTSPDLHSAIENPAMAPSVPLRRSQSTRIAGSGQQHRRTNSELAGAAALVNNMYRGAPPAPTSGQMSPGLVSPRNSFFGPLPIAPPGASGHVHASRTPSGTVASDSIAEEAGSSSGSVARAVSDHAEDKVGIDTPSPPRPSATFGPDRAASVMAGNKVRPLRLVQESADAQADQMARNKANRGSWMAGWFGRGRPEDEGMPKRTFSGDASISRGANS